MIYGKLTLLLSLWFIPLLLECSPLELNKWNHIKVKGRYELPENTTMLYSAGCGEIGMKLGGSTSARTGSCISFPSSFGSRSINGNYQTISISITENSILYLKPSDEARNNRAVKEYTREELEAYHRAKREGWKEQQEIFKTELLEILSEAVRRKIKSLETIERNRSSTQDSIMEELKISGDESCHSGLEEIAPAASKYYDCDRHQKSLTNSFGQQPIDKISDCSEAYDQFTETLVNLLNICPNSSSDYFCPILRQHEERCPSEKSCENIAAQLSSHCS